MEPAETQRGTAYQVTGYGPGSPRRRLVFGYDGMNRLASRMDALGATATYTYDGLGQLTGVRYLDEGGAVAGGLDYRRYYPRIIHGGKKK